MSPTDLLAFTNFLPLGSVFSRAPVPLHSPRSKTEKLSIFAEDSFGIVSKFNKQKTSGDCGYGQVHLIGTGPGDPKLMTLGAVELMREAEIVLYDRLVSDAILAYVNPAAEKICVGKGRGIGTGSQKSIQEQMAYHARKGKRVVRLKGGDPSVFGRVGSEIAYLEKQEIEVSVTPGITTASAVAASLGFPLTHGGIVDGVCLVTGHQGATWVTRELLDRLTLVVYMGLQELANLLERLNNGGTQGPVAAVAVQSGTTKSQRVVYGNTHNLARKVESEGLRSPTIIIIGKTVSMATDWPDEDE